MNKKLLSVVIGSMFLTFLALFMVVSQDVRTAEGSVAVGQEYTATTTESTLSTTACMPVMTSYKTLGSVIITLTSNAGLRIYDATTTAAYAYGASSTIAVFPTTVAGTYTFDARATRGLCIMSSGAVGVASSTITWRY
jgi:hypothetical protein